MRVTAFPPYGSWLRSPQICWIDVITSEQSRLREQIDQKAFTIAARTGYSIYWRDLAADLLHMKNRRSPTQLFGAADGGLRRSTPGTAGGLTGRCRSGRAAS